MPFADLDHIVAQAQAGHLISFPTDTVAGLAAQPEQASQIFAAKQREANKPLILLGAAAADLWPYIQGNDAQRAEWQRVADRWWPGALTLVLPASDRVPTAINPHQTGAIGIRVPNHPVAQAILARTGPLATTSVNRSGEPPLLSPEAIAATFPDVWVVDPAVEVSVAAAAARPAWSEVWMNPQAAVPSTVAQWTEPNQWSILRSGAVTLAQIQSC